MTSSVDRLVEEISDLYLNKKLSDVTIVIGGIEHPAHRVILSQRCPYFLTMFDCEMIKSVSPKVELTKTPLDGFLVILKWIYTGTVKFSSVNMAIETLHLACKYELQEVVSVGVDFLKNICVVDNVCGILNEAHELSLTELVNFSIDVINVNVSEILKHKTIENLSTDALIIVLKSFRNVGDLEVFHAVVRWMKANPLLHSAFRTVMWHVPLSFITLKQVANLPLEVFDPRDLFELIREQLQTHFVHKLKNRNVAMPMFDTKVIAGSDSSIFDPATKLQHVIKDDKNYIIIDLRQRFRLNTFNLTLSDSKSFSYSIEVSENDVDWVSVIDRTQYVCCNFQNLHFTPRSLRYVRIHGTGLSEEKVFGITNFEAIYSTKLFQIDPITTLITPSTNIALIDNGAVVIKGSNSEIINGCFDKYDGNHGFTDHDIGDDGIIVQLSQPYIVSSMKLRLWDKGNRVYTYEVEVSVDQKTWTPIFYEKKVASWREIYFDKQVVVFIKIRGTYNSYNNSFHCVHLECPAVTFN